ncbi:MAG: GNAT family N-acetyltransferase [Lentisphaerae bacterium]|nr:GNAT family N-acetyltransferase [Lentisphaerota bacterium]
MIIKRVQTGEEVVRVAALAREIWNEHYVSIVGQEQVDYMLATFQSAEAIQSQMESGYEYYFSLDEKGEASGYIALIPNEPPGKMMLSKLYVRAAFRGTGVGRDLVAYAKKRAGKLGATSVWLTVNRNNLRTIEWYHRKGFVITDEVKKEIGSGFFMDDYLMEVDV